MNAIDQALQSVTPTVMVPRHEQLEELSVPGHRILMAGNGVWLEVFRAWFYTRMPLTYDLPIAVPYGAVTAERRLACGPIPKDLVARFVVEARVRCPNECAAWVIWNESTREWKLMMLDEILVAPDRAVVNLPRLEDDEHLILDIHSHGLHEAYFSPTDDEDDAGACKIAGVIGNLNKEAVSTSFRFCVDGMFETIGFEF
jgi:PRTRC genetic system protein A